MLLFELSRHSDHHMSAEKPYQALRTEEASPQMPNGYPGMVLLALVPPLWFSIMDRRLPTTRSTVESP
jgi:alkane 1-monooxygenase